jgi:hypothetical protein
MKRLQSGPHEQIPEDLLRRAIAEQDGIKLEEVTFQRVRFEVAGLLQTYPAITLILSAKPNTSIPDKGKSQNESEVARRQKLLDDYKPATSNPSNRRIYDAENSPIHKPQFYKWLKGSLPRDSATTINFERFLREKKVPVP